MKKVTNIIEQKKKELETLQGESNQALSIVTNTINQLSTVNEKINSTISEINTLQNELKMTENELSATQEHNAKIINKFKAIIEI